MVISTKENATTARNYSFLEDDEIVTSFNKYSFIINKGTKAPITAHTQAKQRKKGYVQKVFVLIALKCTPDDLQKLLYLDIYQEISQRAELPPHEKKIKTSSNSRLSSPYFVQGRRPKAKHLPLALRFLKMIKRRKVQLLPKDPLQPACAFQHLWEEAHQMVEQQKETDSPLFEKADRLVSYGKALPSGFCPLEEKKNIVNATSLTPQAKFTCPPLKAQEKSQVQRFIQAALEFGYEYYCLN